MFSSDCFQWIQNHGQVGFFPNILCREVSCSGEFLSKKRKFSNNQIVVFRFGDRKIVGKVILVRPVGKKFTYDVYAEDGKIYSELLADVPLNLSIDTYLTKLFYK